MHLTNEKSSAKSAEMRSVLKDINLLSMRFKVLFRHVSSLITWGVSK